MTTSTARAKSTTGNTRYPKRIDESIVYVKPSKNKPGSLRNQNI